MLELGVKKGDFVTLYMPMVPEAAVAMLACARLGAPHSVVFAGFSAEALRDRVVVSLRRVRCDNRSDCLALVPELSTGRSAALLILAEPRPRLSLALDVAEPTLEALRDRVVVSLRRVRCDNRSDCLALVPELSSGRSAALLILAEPRPRLSLALDVAEPTLACLGSPELS